jgi:hypothetical protein
MPLTADEITKAANAAGIDTFEKAQLAFALVNAFIAAGIDSAELAATFAQRSALQMAAVAQQAQLVNLGRARDDALAAANASIAALQTQINATNAALQATVPANP